MKQSKIYLYILISSFTACKVDKEFQPKLQNDVQEFSFIKMYIDDDTIDQSLNYYQTWDASYSESVSDIVFRDFNYIGSNERQSPYDNYFDKVSRIYMEFRTQTSDLTSRIGETMELTREFNVNDNRLEFAVTYRGKRLAYSHIGGETVKYLEIKDTVIDNRDYELCHLEFGFLVLSDDDGNETVATDIELRQVARKD